MSDELPESSRSSHTFCELPFRVVILNILPFYKKYYNVGLVNNNKLELFGFFKTDPFRKILFLFQSLVFGGGDFPIIDSRRLFSLYLKNPGKRELESVIRNSSRLLKLDHLKILIGREDSVESVANVFSVSDCFPNLTRFSIFFELEEWNGADLSKWHVERRLWTNLVSFELDCDYFVGNVFSLFQEHSEYLKNLKSLDLYNVYLEEKCVLNLAELEVLTLFRCDNVHIEVGSNLKVFEYDKEENESSFNDYQNMVTNIVNKSPQLTSLDISAEDSSFSEEQERNSLFDLNPLHHLKFLRIEDLDFEKNKKIDLSENVQEMELSGLGLSQINFIESQFPEDSTIRFKYLQVLTISDEEYFSDGYFPISEQIKKLSLIRIEKMNADFLIESEWCKLETLVLERIEEFKFRDYRSGIFDYSMAVNGPQFLPVLSVCKFPSLKHLDVLDSNLPDYFFSGTCCVESLVVEKLFCGFNYSMETDFLKSIRFENCEIESIHFLSLEKIFLVSCTSVPMHATYWSSTMREKNLKVLVIDDCEIPNDCFRREIKPLDYERYENPERKSHEINVDKRYPLFLALEVLKLRGISEITGSQWTGFPKLNIFEVKNCEKFNDSFFREDLAQAKCLKEISIINCKEVKGRYWNYFENLNFLKLIDVADDFSEEFFGWKSPFPKTVVISKYKKRKKRM